MKSAPIVRVTRISRSPSKKSHSVQSKLTSETQRISTQSPDRNNSERTSITKKLTSSTPTKQQRISGVSVQRTINVSIIQDNPLNQETLDASASSHTASARNYSGVSIQRLPTTAVIRERLSSQLSSIEISKTESRLSKSSLPAGVHVERILNERRRHHRVNAGSASSENSNESELNSIRRFSGAHVGPSPTTMEASGLPYKSLSMDSINQSDPAPSLH
ncbi:unnamed protein product, partial [Rotaria socialis]